MGQRGNDVVEHGYEEHQIQLDLESNWWDDGDEIVYRCACGAVFRDGIRAARLKAQLHLRRVAERDLDDV